MLMQSESETALSRRPVVEETKTKKYSKSHPKQKKFDRTLMDVLCDAHLPFSLVTNPQFRELISTCDDRLSVPCRASAASHLLNERATDIRDRFMEPTLQNAITGCLSYDLWQSITTSDVCGLVFTTVHQDFQISDVFLGLVESFSTTGSAVAEDVLKTLNSNNLEAKVIGICRDGGANLAKCAKELQLSVSNPFDEDFFFDSRCIAHSLSLCCNNAMKSDSLISDAKKAINKCITWTRK